MSAKGKNNPDLIELRFLEGVIRRLPEDVEALQALAELYTKTENFDAGLDVDIKLSQLLSGDDLVWYNLGCSYALMGDLDRAFDAITRAVELGYVDYDWMKMDADLKNLHGDPRFESILNWLYTACSEEDG